MLDESDKQTLTRMGRNCGLRLVRMIRFLYVDNNLQQLLVWNSLCGVVSNGPLPDTSSYFPLSVANIITIKRPTFYLYVFCVLTCFRLIT